MEARIKGKGSICSNCGQWQYAPSWEGAFYDCCNDCALRGFAPKVQPDNDESKALAI